MGGRRPGTALGIGTIRMWSFNTWIIAINIAIFLIDGLLVRFGYQPVIALGGYFSAETAIQHGQVWRFISFQFLHAGLGHIFMNMLGLFFFGPLIERYLGSRRYLAFYLLCGVAGPVAYMLLWASGFLVTHPAQPLVGASAGVFGVLIAAAFVAPNADVYIWGILPVKMRHLAWLLIAVAAYTVLFYGDTGRHNAGGEAAHLGGAALGYLLIRRPHLLRWANRKIGPPSLGGLQSPKSKDRIDDKEVDRILKKVHEQGITSLTERERDTLAKASRR